MDSRFECMYGNKAQSGNHLWDSYAANVMDDNKILFSFDQTETCEAILHECQRGLQTWDKLLNITGGAVEIRKCMLSLML